MSTTVFVTGASGYIAQHIVNQLLAKGYKVIGSVRSEEKGQRLQEMVNSPNFKYVVIPDIDSPGTVDKTLKENPEVSVVLHTASPVFFTSDDVKKDILDPAVAGTINVLAAIKKYGTNVKKVVYTSSAVAVFPFGTDDKQRKVYTEANFNPITEEQGEASPWGAYFAGKTFAEKAVWKFIRDEKPDFDVSFVLPLYVFGPHAYDVKDKSQLQNYSTEMVNSFLKLKPGDEIPANASYFVDVRDVAKAHLAAFENDKAVEQRLLLNTGRFTNELILLIINSRFPETNVPRGDITKSEQQLENDPWISDTSKTDSLLGFKYITLEDSITDSVQQLLSVSG
ncbi:putative NADPH-dependent methylglyoxal reductase GRP2 [Candida viswanathii]|uniref:Putative NADPH-dependent methylglyoxal reductase GRP2 n=1 Tax=Candida viswanathii TaxID=5486 RepID=A0A367XLK5_9ASCO|nr:putative NADPH-dependent methylglyoxal reductase GRP2 [Candida viswanathii]